MPSSTLPAWQVKAEATALHVCWRPPATSYDGAGSWSGASVGWDFHQGDDSPGSGDGRFVLANDPAEPLVSGWGASTIEACMRQNEVTLNASIGETPGCWGQSSKKCSAQRDNECDDGGDGAEFSMCEWGSDCEDCGARQGANPRQHEWKPVTCEAVAAYWESSALGGPQVVKSGAITCSAVGAFWRNFPVIGSGISSGIGTPRASCCEGVGTVSASAAE